MGEKIAINENQLIEQLKNSMAKFASEGKNPAIGIYGSSYDLEKQFVDLIFLEKAEELCAFVQDVGEIESNNFDVIWAFSGLDASVPCYLISSTSENEIKNLLAWTFDALPKNKRAAFVRYQKVDLDLKEKFANRAIKQHCAAAFAVGANPFSIGISDNAILVTSEIALMGRILAIYDIENVQQVIKTIGFSTIMGNLLTGAGQNLAFGLLKFIPGAGHIVGGALYGSSALAVTLAFGKSVSKVAKALCKASMQNNMEQIRYIGEHFAEAVAGTAVACLENGNRTVEDYEQNFDGKDIPFESLKSNIEKGNELFQKFLDNNSELDNAFNDEQEKSDELSSKMMDSISRL